MDNDKFIQDFKGKLQTAISTAVDARFKNEERRLVTTIGQDLAKMLQPFLQEVAQNAKTSKENLREVMQELAATASGREFAGIDTGAIIEAIYVAFGNVQMPQPKVNITSPKIDVPPLRWPDGNMPIEGWVQLQGVSLQNPLPVQLRDAKGNPVNLGAITQISGGGGYGGGKGDYFTIKGFSASAYAEYLNADNRLRVSVETGGGGLTDTELRASSVPVSQVSGAMWSTAVVDIFGSTAAASVFNADNRIRVSVETGGSGLTDAELRASAVPVVQVSGAAESVNVVTTVGLTDTQLRASSVPVEQVSGSIWSTYITGATGTIAANVVDSGGVPYTTTNPLPVGDAGGSLTVDGTVTVGSITASIAANVVDSAGIPYTTSNPLPVGDAGGSLTIDGSVSVTGSITSTVVTGPTVADAVDDGSAPVQGGGIARTANPTAVAANDVVKSTHDDLGRQIVRTVQVRDLIQTAYVQITTGTETTLRAAVAGAYLDLIYVMGANNSDAAVSVDIRAVTAGGVVMTLQIPASGTAGIACPVPLPQQETGNNWTADMADITGTTVSLTALFSQEV